MSESNQNNTNVDTSSSLESNQNNTNVDNTSGVESKAESNQNNSVKDKVTDLLGSNLDTGSTTKKLSDEELQHKYLCLLLKGYDLATTEGYKLYWKQLKNTTKNKYALHGKFDTWIDSMRQFMNGSEEKELRSQLLLAVVNSLREKSKEESELDQLIDWVVRTKKFKESKYTAEVKYMLFKHKDKLDFAKKQDYEKYKQKINRYELDDDIIETERIKKDVGLPTICQTEKDVNEVLEWLAIEDMLEYTP